MTSTESGAGTSAGRARERIALAADLPLRDALSLYGQLREHVGYVKVGLSLFVEHGPRAVTPFTEQGARVFLDLKLHDIPNTVEHAARKAGALGVDLLTVHASGGAEMLRAAARGAKAGAEQVGRPPPRILAVTVLTSLSAEALTETGVADAPERQVERLAQLAMGNGAGGLVCSPREAASLRRVLGNPAFLCTPGIRPVGAAAGDQARAETPSAAIRAGASLLVVGRPLYEAGDPLEAAKALVREVEEASACQARAARE